LPVVNEDANLRVLIPKLTALLDRERLTHEIVVMAGGSTDGTRETAESLGGRVVAERRRGYAGALGTGFAEARGDYVLTIDADQSHDPDFIAKMWRARERGDIVIASRYARGGVAYATFVRRATSWLLNAMLRWNTLDARAGSLQRLPPLSPRRALEPRSSQHQLRSAGGNPGQGVRDWIHHRRGPLHIFFPAAQDARRRSSSISDGA
jgi:glycosyltransferase involved in cell wall biosynthesis